MVKQWTHASESKWRAGFGALKIETNERSGVSGSCEQVDEQRQCFPTSCSGVGADPHSAGCCPTPEWLNSSEYDFKGQSNAGTAPGLTPATGERSAAIPNGAQWVGTTMPASSAPGAPKTKYSSGFGQGVDKSLLLSPKLMIKFKKTASPVSTPSKLLLHRVHRTGASLEDSGGKAVLVKGRKCKKRPPALLMNKTILLSPGYILGSQSSNQPDLKLGAPSLRLDECSDMMSSTPSFVSIPGSGASPCGMFAPPKVTEFPEDQLVVGCQALDHGDSGLLPPSCHGQVLGHQSSGSSDTASSTSSVGSGSGSPCREGCSALSQQSSRSTVSASLTSGMPCSSSSAGDAFSVGLLSHSSLGNIFEQPLPPAPRASRLPSSSECSAVEKSPCRRMTPSRSWHGKGPAEWSTSTVADGAMLKDSSPLATEELTMQQHLDSLHIM